MSINWFTLVVYIKSEEEQGDQENEMNFSFKIARTDLYKTNVHSNTYKWQKKNQNWQK
jgi:hypothetical protein